MFYVDLNSDLGESFGNYTIGMDEEILQYVSSANVACGWHAGDPVVLFQRDFKYGHKLPAGVPLSG